MANQCELLCVRISFHDECTRWCDRKPGKLIGWKDAEKRIHVPQRTHNLSSVHYEESVVTIREESIRKKLWYSKYNRQVIATGYAFLNFNSILILRLSGFDVCLSDSP